MIRNSRVPTPENKRVVGTGKPVSTGTRNVAPNMATTCCTPIAIVAGQFNRSEGATTSPGATDLPSPWRDQIFMGFLSPARACRVRGRMVVETRGPRRHATAPLRRHAQMLAGGGARGVVRLSGAGVRHLDRVGAVGVGEGRVAPFALGRDAELIEKADHDLALLGSEGRRDAEAAGVLAPDGGLGGRPRLRVDHDGERPAVGGMRRAPDVTPGLEPV